MGTEVPVQGVVEQFQLILECEGICLVLGCPDPELRHPLLDALPIATSSLVICRSGLFAETCRFSLMQHERIQALCDLAMQSGRMQVLQTPESLLQRWHVQSLAAMPLERPVGTLGTLLLADKRPERFGMGEERLLYACLSIYAQRLERLLWEQASELTLDYLRQTGADGALDEPIKSEFISMVGHELRAPLSIIKGYTALLQIYGDSARPQGEEMTPELQRHYLDVIMEQTGLLELLVNDLLDITRLQQGRLALDPGLIDIGPFCQQIVQLGQLRADQQAEGKHRFVCTIAGQLPPVLADIDRLRQVLLNVIENAIKYSPDGGCIELIAGLAENLEQPDSSSPRGFAAVYLTIRDQGVGIPSAYTGRLFRPFERLERSAIAHIPGSGLGLYIAQKLVEAMSGRIEVESEQGRGTAVTIFLPTTDAGKLRVHELPNLVRSLNGKEISASLA